MRPHLGRTVSKRLIALSLLVIIIIALGLLAWHHHSGLKKQTPSFAETAHAPSTQTLMNGQNQAAAKALSKKNYDQAAASYLSEAGFAQSSKNYKQAESILQAAIKNIPDKYVPWTIYDSLYGVAKTLNDKTVEISSLQKALNKVEQPNSGAPDGMADFYKQQLKALGA
ncbi:MAG TPA: hypothetical protein VHD84_03600 [Candidatus Saccharimonadales bacterium]|nr:hypothetical protein [Candidatus Saccharimonadales bacterium]